MDRSGHELDRTVRPRGRLPARRPRRAPNEVVGTEGARSPFASVDLGLQTRGWRQKLRRVESTWWANLLGLDSVPGCHEKRCATSPHPSQKHQPAITDLCGPRTAQGAEKTSSRVATGLCRCRVRRCLNPACCAWCFCEGVSARPPPSGLCAFWG